MGQPWDKFGSHRPLTQPQITPQITFPYQGHTEHKIWLATSQTPSLEDTYGIGAKSPHSSTQLGHVLVYIGREQESPKLPSFAYALSSTQLQVTYSEATPLRPCVIIDAALTRHNITSATPYHL